MRIHRLIGIIALVLVVVTVGVIFGIFAREKLHVAFDAISGISIYKLEPEHPDLSGWVAWWREDDGLRMARTMAASGTPYFTTVSPYWYLLSSTNESSLVRDVGTTTKREIVAHFHALHMRVVPLIGNELAVEEFSTVLRKPQTRTILVTSIAQRIKAINADGIDVDLEGVRLQDEEQYIAFLRELSDVLKSQGQQLSVSVLSATGNETDWEIARAQDLEAIGEIADEVRVMAYDEHGHNTGPGPIASSAWQKRVLQHMVAMIPREKIVVGIPNYGYLWNGTSTTPLPLPYDEFVRTVDSTSTYIMARDDESKGLRFTVDPSVIDTVSVTDTTPHLYQEGWLSDHVTMINLIRNAQKLGLNRFIIWNLGGMDERLFSDSF